MWRSPANQWWVDPYVNAASEADDQERLIIADIDLTQTQQRGTAAIPRTAPA